MGSTFLAVYALTLYWKRMTRLGAWGGMLGGFAVSMLWYLFIYAKTASKIWDPLLVESYTINLLDPLFVAIPVSFILAIVLSLLKEQSDEEREIADKAFRALEEEEPKDVEEEKEGEIGKQDGEEQHRHLDIMI